MAYIRVQNGPCEPFTQYNNSLLTCLVAHNTRTNFTLLALLNMYTFNIVALAPIFFSLPKSLAYPSNALDTKTFPGTSARGQLFRRLGSNDGSSENNAIEIFLESTAGWPAIAEGDCYAILCLGEPRILYIISTQLSFPARTDNKQAKAGSGREP